MGFNQLVYRLGRLYRNEREAHPEIEFPYLSGSLADLLDETALETLPELQGEYVIVYNDSQGANHFIRVYIEDGLFEAEGTPQGSDGFLMTSSAGPISED